jgi:hypothetical protein
MGLYSVVGAVVVNHARSVDASHVELVDEIETLGPADALPARLGVLSVLDTFLALLAALPTPALLMGL